jgi:hypothetical protein
MLGHKGHVNELNLLHCPLAGLKLLENGVMEQRGTKREQIKDDYAMLICTL